MRFPPHNVPQTSIYQSVTREPLSNDCVVRHVVLPREHVAESHGGHRRTSSCLRHSNASLRQMIIWKCEEINRESSSPVKFLMNQLKSCIHIRFCVWLEGLLFIHSIIWHWHYESYTLIQVSGRYGVVAVTLISTRKSLILHSLHGKTVYKYSTVRLHFS